MPSAVCGGCISDISVIGLSGQSHDFDENKQLDHKSITNFPLFDKRLPQLFHKSNRPLFLWVYRRNKPLGMLGEHSKNL